MMAWESRCEMMLMLFVLSMEQQGIAFACILSCCFFYYKQSKARFCSEFIFLVQMFASLFLLLLVRWVGSHGGSGRGEKIETEC